MIGRSSVVTFTGDHITTDPSLDNWELRLPLAAATAAHLTPGAFVQVTNKTNHRTIPLAVVAPADDKRASADGDDRSSTSASSTNNASNSENAMSSNPLRLSEGASRNLQIAAEDQITVRALPSIKPATRIVIIPVADTQPALAETSPASHLAPYFARAEGHPIGAKTFVHTTTETGDAADFFVTEVAPGPDAGLVTAATRVHANDGGVAIERADAEAWAAGRTLRELHPEVPAPRDPAMAPERLEGKDPAEARGAAIKRFLKARLLES